MAEDQETTSTEIIIEHLPNNSEIKCYFCQQQALKKIRYGSSGLHICSERNCYEKALQLLYTCEANFME